MVRRHSGRFRGVTARVDHRFVTFRWLLLCLPILGSTFAAAGNLPAQGRSADPTQLSLTQKDSAVHFMKDRKAANSLAVMQFCVDSLGLPSDVRHADSCMPCLPYQMQTSAEGSLRHAVSMWDRLSRAPYGEDNSHANCVRVAFEYASILSEDSRDARFRHALFGLASANPTTRTRALSALDALTDTALSRGDSTSAVLILRSIADDLADRSYGMYVHPDKPSYSKIEKAVHELTEGLPPLARIPAPPASSKQPGLSEAGWAARLYQSALDLSANTALRAELRKLIVSAFAQVEDWHAIDSVGVAALRQEPKDSIALLARAVAAWKTRRFSLADYADIERSFMSALAAMSPADSAAYDDFTDVLTPEDDAWRFGFIPSVRQQLDMRAWTVMDPLWITPVNEVRLERMARKALGDFLFARAAEPGMGGSETDAGIVTVKRGPPVARWTVASRQRYYRALMGWRGMRIAADITDESIFYSEELRPERLALERIVCPDVRQKIVNCARKQAADFNDVLFQALLDTVDVSLARFRSAGDSVDIYMSARIPLRGFRSQGERGTSKRDSIEYGAMITGTLGEPLFDSRMRKPLPRRNEIAWTDQWVARTGDGNIMHRVEAIDPGNARGARGAAFLASDDAALFRLSGFGLSDILPAAKLTLNSNDIRTWRDFDVVPNGGVVMPGYPVSLLWEIYDLTADEEDMMRWQVSVQLGEGEVKRGFNGKLMMSGAPDRTRQVTVNEDDVSGTRYTRTAPASKRVVERLELNLDDVPAGRHVLIVTVEDLVARKKVQREVALRVLTAYDQVRGQGHFPASEVTGYDLMLRPDVILTRRRRGM